MGIEDRDYMKGKKGKIINNDYIYNPKEFRDTQTLVKPSENASSTGSFKSILVWILVALVFFVIFKSLEQRKGNSVNLPAITPQLSVMPGLQFPENGSTILYQKITSPSAKLTVLSEKGKTENCVVKLETWDSGIPVIELFVRAGEQGETQLVPLGKYRVKMVCGERWYGKNEMFGGSSRISIGVTPLQFWQSGNTVYGQTLTLTKRIDGNFKLTDSYYNQF